MIYKKLLLQVSYYDLKFLPNRVFILRQNISGMLLDKDFLKVSLITVFLLKLEFFKKTALIFMR